MPGSQTREREVPHRFAMRERPNQANDGISPLDGGAYDRCGFRRCVVHSFKLAHAMAVSHGDAEAFERIVIFTIRSSFGYSTSMYLFDSR